MLLYTVPKNIVTTHRFRTVAVFSIISFVSFVIMELTQPYLAWAMSVSSVMAAHVHDAWNMVYAWDVRHRIPCICTTVPCVSSVIMELTELYLASAMGSSLPRWPRIVSERHVHMRSTISTLFQDVYFDDVAIYYGH